MQAPEQHAPACDTQNVAMIALKVDTLNIEQTRSVVQSHLWPLSADKRCREKPKNDGPIKAWTCAQ